MKDQLVTVGLKNLNLLSGDLLVDEQTDGGETCGTLEVLIGDISLTNFALVASSLEEEGENVLISGILNLGMGLYFLLHVHQN